MEAKNEGLHLSIFRKFPLKISNILSIEQLLGNCIMFGIKRLQGGIKHVLFQSYNWKD